MISRVRRQQTLLCVVERLTPSQVLQVVPSGVTRSEAHALRRAARQLALQGKARAVYRRLPDSRGRWAATLCLANPESDLLSDAFPHRSPHWVAPPPITLESLSAVLQAAVLSVHTGTTVSVSTANRAAQKYRESRGKPA